MTHTCRISNPYQHMASFASRPTVCRCRWVFVFPVLSPINPLSVSAIKIVDLYAIWAFHKLLFKKSTLPFWNTIWFRKMKGKGNYLTINLSRKPMSGLWVFSWLVVMDKQGTYVSIWSYPCGCWKSIFSCC